MTIVTAIILGALQGLTEFFPVSSSAHLALTPWIFRFKDPGLAFDIALHAGTFLAVFFAFFTDWKKLFISFFNAEMRQERKIALYLLLTAIPGAIIGVLLEEKAQTVFRSPLVVATTLVAFGLILYFIDKKAPEEKKDQASVTLSDSIVIGLSQAIAIIPGVSRSGATITAGRALGLSREESARYSFMAALPIIGGATLYGLRDTSLNELLSIPWILGFVAALLASLYAIKFLLEYLKKNDFKIFLFWRLGLAAVVLLLYFLRS